MKLVFNVQIKRMKVICYGYRQFSVDINLLHTKGYGTSKNDVPYPFRIVKVLLCYPLLDCIFVEVVDAAAFTPCQCGVGLAQFFARIVNGTAA